MNYNNHPGNKTGKNKTSYILVLDDDYDITVLIKLSLEKQGYQVFGFTDPSLALEHFQINQSIYDLVLSDLRMPSMSGFQFLNEIKLTKPEVKVFLMSAFDMAGDFSEYSRSYGNNKIDGYIQKPVSTKKLNVLVNSCMMSK